ncbi:hypothetical protein BZA77DRAFT_355135 [Pyronema omphalodes]|nr:hypothetical protein BZA77DRAFT_355135 [Pyronema omphalodes]
MPSEASSSIRQRLWPLMATLQGGVWCALYLALSSRISQVYLIPIGPVLFICFSFFSDDEDDDIEEIIMFINAICFCYWLFGIYKFLGTLIIIFIEMEAGAQ